MFSICCYWQRGHGINWCNRSLFGDPSCDLIISTHYGHSVIQNAVLIKLSYLEKQEQWKRSSGNNFSSYFRHFLVYKSCESITQYDTRFSSWINVLPSCFASNLCGFKIWLKFQTLLLLLLLLLLNLWRSFLLATEIVYVIYPISSQWLATSPCLQLRGFLNCTS